MRERLLERFASVAPRDHEEGHEARGYGHQAGNHRGRPCASHRARPAQLAMSVTRSCADTTRVEASNSTSNTRVPGREPTSYDQVGPADERYLLVDVGRPSSAATSS